MVTVFFAIIYLIVDILIGVAASKKGRSGFGWFLLSAFTTPVIAGILLLVLGEK